MPAAETSEGTKKACRGGGWTGRGLCEWREHAGLPYVYTSFAITDPAEARVLSRQQFELIMAEPAGSLVRVLTDARGGLSSGWDREGLKESRDQIKVVTAHVRIRSAIIGVTPLMGALIRGMSAVAGGYSIVPCPTEEKALAYLTRE